MTSFIRPSEIAFFGVAGPYTPETLWRTDGTVEGTFQIGGSDLQPVFPGLRFWVTHSNRAFFTTLLWPTLVRFTTSTAEVWIEQQKTGIVRYYRLEGVPRDSSDLNGLFDKQGFRP